MLGAKQFKSGIALEIDGELCLILEAQHIKPGKGGAFVRTKFRNLRTGSIVERNFRSEDSFTQAFMEEKKMQFIYKGESSYHCMDQATYDEVNLNEDLIGESAKFLKDGMEITASLYKNKIVGIALPPFVDLKVTYTEPGLKGDTARAASKPATLETGAVIKVPLFIDTGDVIKIDTRSGEYAGRV